MTTRAVTDEDTDLHDLLEGGESSASTQKYSNYYNRGKARSRNDPSGSAFSAFLRLPELMCYFLTSFLLNNPLIGKISVLAFLAMILFSLLAVTTNKTQQIGVINYDFSSKYDLNIGKINRWCVDGGNDCECPDPLTPTPRLHKQWFNSVKIHREYVEKVPNPDIVFLGQTLVEAFNARINGHDMSKNAFFGKVQHDFGRKFQVTAGPTTNPDENAITATAMGLTGDHSSNVLWRLMNGELPETFNPSVWWLVVGMEDVGRYGCSEEITTMGVMRIVEEIKKRRPNAKIVVNSLLPMTKMRMEQADDEEEFMDAKRDNGKGPHAGSKNHRKRKSRSDRSLRQLEDEKLSAKEKAMRKKKMEIARKKYHKQVKHDKFNPIMKDVSKWKRKRGRKIGRGKGIPMWSAVHVINGELHKFCKTMKYVSFFDATSIFTVSGNGDGLHLSSELISPRGHPTLKGFKEWMNAISEQAQVYKKKIDAAKEDPEEEDWRPNIEDYYYGDQIPDEEVDLDDFVEYDENHPKPPGMDDDVDSEKEEETQEDGNTEETATEKATAVTEEKAQEDSEAKEDDKKEENATEEKTQENTDSEAKENDKKEENATEEETQEDTDKEAKEEDKKEENATEGKTQEDGDGKVTEEEE